MASGNRSGYGSWELDKGEINFDYCDVGLGLKLPWHHQQQQQQQQEQRQNSISWLQNHSENSRSPSPSPTISGISPFSRFGVTFTAGQRQELERQTMIFKHMMASLPVPAELLMPFPKYPSSPIKTPSSEVGRKTGVEMRYGGNRGGGGDAEPWRCRRTDGKKWRCSRDVAPDQKYCERHSHKGRPSRSRKPVESPSSSSSLSLLSSSSSLSSPSSSLLSSSVTPTTTTPCNPIMFTPFSIPKPSSSSFDLPSPQFNPLPRYPEWFMKKEVAPNASSCLFSQHLGTSNETTTSTVVVDDHQSCLLPRPFIDAWSLGDHLDPKDATTTTTNNNNATVDNENDNRCRAPSSPLNSILPLTLSMSAGFDPDHHDNSVEHAKDSPEMRLSSSSQNHHHHHQPLNWMSSWISSPPGGPLAEALCLGISGGGNGMMSRSDDLVSPHGHSTSSSTTTLG